MKSLFYVATILALVFSGYVCVADSKLLAPKRLSHNAQGGIEFFKSKLANELMSAEEFSRYAKAISDLDCKGAGQLLTNAFFRTYPQFKTAQTRYDCEPTDFIDCADWEFYAVAVFKGYAFCTLNEDLQSLEHKLHQSMGTVPRYSMPRFPTKKHYDNDDLRGRDEVLASIIAQAEGGHILSLEKVAGLLRQGDVFEAKSDVEYYVLRLACLHGSDCSRWQGRLAGLKTTLGAKRSEHIDAIAKKPNLRQPRLNDLILGKSL